MQDSVPSRSDDGSLAALRESGTSLRSRLAAAATGWLPEEPPVRLMLVVSFVDSLGTGLFLTGSALFFTLTIGLTAAQVGLGLSLAGVAGFLCSVPVGRLSDRVGALPTLVALQMWRAACFFAYPLVGNFRWFLVVACAAGMGEWAAGPVVQSLLGSLVPPASRVRTMAALTLLRNVGFVVGAGAATATIAVGGSGSYSALVILDGCSFLFSGLLLVRLRRSMVRPAGEPGAPAPRAPRKRSPLGARFLLLTVLNGVLYLHNVVLSVGLPLWIATRTRGPSVLLGAVVLVNTLLAVALQMRLSRGVDDAASAAVRQLRAGCLLALCCVLVAVTGRTSPSATSLLIVAATAALTVAEIFQAVGAWGVSYSYAPEADRGYHLSVYNLGVVGSMIVGPWLLTSVVLPAGPIGWTSLAAVVAAAGFIVPAVVRGRRVSAPVDSGSD